VHKGFGFVDFEEAEDAAAAIENMDGAEVYGKVLKVNIAKPGNKNIPHGKSLWSAEEWIESNLAEADMDADGDAAGTGNQ
jgi:peptidyl-prolyl isomerase E (cyclophilin E)